jgi:phage tail sheath protein FI
MLEVLHPGIFFDEVVASDDGANTRVVNQVPVNYGATKITGAPLGVASFVGTAPRGALLKPVLLTSWIDYVNEFGGFDVNSMLAYAVKGFFENGGQRCYVVRTVKYNAGVKSSAIASLLLKDSTGTTDSIKVEAKNDGVWGNNLSVVVEAGSVAGKFNLKVYYKGVVAEQYINEDLTTIEANDDASKLIRCTVIGSQIPKPLTSTSLTGGQDGLTGIADADYTAGIDMLKEIDINLIAVPNITSQAVQKYLTDFADKRNDCFAILDAPMSMTAGQVATYVTSTASFNTQFGAMYFPYVVVSDPIGIGKNPTKKVPPSGHVCGIIARTHATLGVWRAPAGIEAQVYGIIDLEHRVSDSEQDVLNPINVNCLRQFDGVGIVVWGTRLMNSDATFRYIPTRATVTYIEDSLAKDMKWTNFKPNDETLWRMIASNVDTFLNGIWVNRGLKGATPAEAYFVKCDEEINTPDVVDMGKTFCDIGLALNKPNEFTIFRLSLRK